MATSTCPHCGRDESIEREVLSRHTTSEGIVSWTRCACGAVQLRLRRHGTASDDVRARGPARGPSGPRREPGPVPARVPRCRGPRQRQSGSRRKSVTSTNEPSSASRTTASGVRERVLGRTS